MIPILLLVHGIIHLMGFAKAYGLADIDQLSKSISRGTGIIWLLATILFIIDTIRYFQSSSDWFYLAIVAVIISQMLVFVSWQDAKFGTIPNLIILLVSIIAYAGVHFEQSFNQDVQHSKARISVDNTRDIMQSDLFYLPIPVQKYLNYVGVIGKPIVDNVYIEMHGTMRDKGKDWFSFNAHQYSFSEAQERLFFMKASLKYLPVYGYHRYKDGAASMQIKLASLIPVVDINNEMLLKAETVTFFNDLCLLFPASLISKNIHWETVDARTVRAIYTVKDISITATLYFNPEGQLINFESDDRIDIKDMQAYRFSTPVRSYKNFNGYNLPAYGEAIWHYPEGPFTYGRFNIDKVIYNTYSAN